MRQALKRRLAQLDRIFGSRRIPTEVVRQHFEHFRKTGELPDDKHLAIAVRHRVKRGYDLFYERDGGLDWPKTLRLAGGAPMRAEDEIMDMLMFEAVYSTGVTRSLARCALEALAVTGHDVTTTLFAGSGVALPEYGSVGAMLMSPCLARAPYEEQCGRLFARIDILRIQVPQGDSEWLAQMHEAAADFQCDGVRPVDELVLECALALAEVSALLSHASGRDVRATMAALDSAATTKGDARDVAICQVQELAASGRFLGEAA